MRENLISIFNYTVHNQAGALDIFIDGDIVDASTQEILKNFWGDETSTSFKSFRNQIITANPQIVNVTVTSDGGHVGDAMAIYDFLQDLKSKGVQVNTKATGIVASAATYPAMAGGPDNSEITDNAWAMIHNVSGAVRGPVEVIENYAKTLRKFNDRIVDFYTNTTKNKREDIVQWMNDETFMDAETARARGFFSDKKSPAVNYTKLIKPENWQYKNTSVMEAYNKLVTVPTNNDKTMFEKFTELFNSACEAAGIKVNNKGVAEGLTIENLNKAMNTALTGLEPTLTAAINKAVEEKVATLADTFKNLLTEAKLAKADVTDKLTTDVAALNTTVTAIQADLVNKVTPTNPAGGAPAGGAGAVKDEFPHAGIGWDKVESAEV